MFVTTDNVIISFVELPPLENCGFSVPKDHTVIPSCARVILRTLNGKYCWDASVLHEDTDESDDGKSVSRIYYEINKYSELLVNSSIA